MKLSQILLTLFKARCKDAQLYSDYPLIDSLALCEPLSLVFDTTGRTSILAYVQIDHNYILYINSSIACNSHLKYVKFSRFQKLEVHHLYAEPFQYPQDVELQLLAKVQVLNTMHVLSQTWGSSWPTVA